MSDTKLLAELLAKRFIQRKDVKAIQVQDGGYRPVRAGWKMGDLKAHVDGTKTFGHYTNDAAGLTKLIVLDIDLEKTGTWYEVPSDEYIAENIFSETDMTDSLVLHENVNPRELWHDRRSPARAWLKMQLRCMTDLLSSTAYLQGFEVAAAYSGNKGCHVYVFFDEPTDIALARTLALDILEQSATRISSQYVFEATRGHNFFQFSDPDPYSGYKNLSIEVFPKQDSMEGKELGNLVRLPLGKNHKNPKDPCFFIDQTKPYREITPHPDPVKLLTEGQPFKDGMAVA